MSILQGSTLVNCPACGEPATVRTRVEGVRLEDTGEGQRLYPRVSAYSVLHTCRPQAVRAA